MDKLSRGDSFPDVALESPDGSRPLRELWERGPLVLAFERHFG